jgi:hypothetical protein
MQCVGGTGLRVGGRVHTRVLLENLATSMVESTDTSVPDQAWMELLATYPRQYQPLEEYFLCNVSVARHWV